MQQIKNGDSALHSMLVEYSGQCGYGNLALG